MSEESSELETFNVPFPKYFKEELEKRIGRELSDDELFAEIFLLATIGFKREYDGWGAFK